MEELIKYNNLIHGYKDLKPTIDINERLLKFASSLATIDFLDTYKLQRTPSRQTILTTSEYFLTTKFKLYPISYASDYLIKKKLNNQEVSSIQELITLYNSVGYDISPFKIPIHFVNKPYYHGTVSLQTSLCFEEEFLKQMKIYARYIELSNKTSEFSSLCHIHEIIHLELERLKGSVENYLHSEILSIFMEQVYAYEQDKTNLLLRKNTLNRLNYFFLELHSLLHNNLSAFEQSISSKYIVSILISYQLFTIYLQGDNHTKKYLLSNIQDIFNGQQTLEEMLTKLNITYENSIEESNFINILKR